MQRNNALKHDKRRPLGSAKLERVSHDSLDDLLLLFLRPVLEDSLTQKRAGFILCDLRPVTDAVLETCVQVVRWLRR